MRWTWFAGRLLSADEAGRMFQAEFTETLWAVWPSLAWAIQKEKRGR